jgi:hypothetical protein
MRPTLRTCPRGGPCSAEGWRWRVHAVGAVRAAHALKRERARSCQAPQQERGKPCLARPSNSIRAGTTCARCDAMLARGGQRALVRRYQRVVELAAAAWLDSEQRDVVVGNHCRCGHRQRRVGEDQAEMPGRHGRSEMRLVAVVVGLHHVEAEARGASAEGDPDEVAPLRADRHTLRPHHHFAARLIDHLRDRTARVGTRSVRSGARSRTRVYAPCPQYTRARARLAGGPPSVRARAP